MFLGIVPKLLAVAEGEHLSAIERLAVFGRRDDEWIYVQVGRDIQLNLLTENLREDAALEDKWNSANYFLEETNAQEENRMTGKYVRRNPFKFKDLN